MVVHDDLATTARHCVEQPRADRPEFPHASESSRAARAAVPATFVPSSSAIGAGICLQWVSPPAPPRPVSINFGPAFTSTIALPQRAVLYASIAAAAMASAHSRACRRFAIPCQLVPLRLGLFWEDGRGTSVIKKLSILAATDRAVHMEQQYEIEQSIGLSEL